MNNALACERKLTQLDFGRLNKLGAVQTSSELEELLSEAEVLDTSGWQADFVSMYARVQVEDLASHTVRTLVLCSPDQSEPRDGYVSVLSPIGMSLLGLPLGAVARWRSPSGAEWAVKVISVCEPDQPDTRG